MKPLKIKEIITDGCSKVPDFNFKSCCDKHDINYCIGGSLFSKIKADFKLGVCIASKKPLIRNSFLGIVYFSGVSIFGHSRFNYKK